MAAPSRCRHGDGATLSLPDDGAGRWPLPSPAPCPAPLTQQRPPAGPRVQRLRPAPARASRPRPRRDAVAPAVVLVMSFAGDAGRDLDAGAEPARQQRLRPAFRRRGRQRRRDARCASATTSTAAGRSASTARVARYRIGNGPPAISAPSALVHLVDPDPAEPLDPANPGAPLDFADVAPSSSRSPRRLGEDPETIEHVRQIAPEAFRAVQFRAVTEADWEEVALRHPGVAAAKASFRWTGSWHTVFVAIHPRDAGRPARGCPAAASSWSRLRAPINAHLQPLQAGRLRPGGARRAVCAARDRDPVCVAPRPLPRRRAGGRERALSNRALRRRRARLLPPARASSSASRSTCPGFTRRSRRSTASIRPTVTVFKRYWDAAARRARPRRDRDGPVRDRRGSTTTRAFPRTASCACRGGRAVT